MLQNKMQKVFTGKGSIIMSKIERDLFEGENTVMEAIIGNGYPKESVVLEGQIDTRRFVDFIINDVDTGLPLMIIEVKSCGERTQKSVRKLAYDSLKRDYDKMAFPVKAVAAILDRDKGLLEFIDFTEAVKENDFNRAIDNYNLPRYKILKTGARQKAIHKEKEDQKQRITILKLLCWLALPLVCVSLVVLDALGIYTLSNLRLITVGAGAAVALIPCFKEIKIGEISLKNQIEKQREEIETDG